jgi:hypothetical protein
MHPLPSPAPSGVRPTVLAAALAGLLLGAGCAGPAKTPGAGPAEGATPAAATPTSASAPSLAGSTPGSQVRLPVPAAQPAASAAPAAAAGPQRPPGPPAPPGPPPFAQIIQGADRIEGPLVLWRKDDKVWMEIQPAQFGQPFLLSPKIREGISQAWVLGGLMAMPVNGAGGAQLVEFERVHHQVRLKARNAAVSARPGTPEARAVAASYAASLLGAAPVASQPHPDRRSVLVEANALFLSDITGVGLMLQQGLRQGYGLDRNNSVITGARGTPEATVLETQLHFFTGAPAMVPPNAPPGMPVPIQLRHVPDARSLLVGLHYSIAPLPPEPMRARLADPRLGLFTTAVLDFGDDTPASPRQRIVHRWRLEKADPAAERSRPVRPITFWLDRNIPHAYRETVRAGVLEWNKAFDRIGFIDAIEVQQQPDDADWDTLDFGRASVRWMMNAEPAFGAIGPSHVDPRSGEILDADIAFEGMAARMVRGVRREVLAGSVARAADTPVQAPVHAPALAFARMLGDAAPAAFAEPLAPALAQALHPLHPGHAACLHGALAAEQASYALEVLQARGDLDPDGAESRQFVLDFIKEAIMHEVGHALGLRHNFRASRIYTEAQLSDPEFTRVHGTTGSVMEYNAVNLPRPGERGGLPFQTTLGPYDHWAIEYAYRPVPLVAADPMPDTAAAVQAAPAAEAAATTASATDTASDAPGTGADGAATAAATAAAASAAASAAADAAASAAQRAAARAAASAAAEREMLQAIAARSHEPHLAFGTDEDVALGLDPETLQLDLGDDPVAFAAKRLAIARDLFKRQETRALPPDRDYAVLRRALDFALSDAARATGVLARQIGGVRTLRDFPGSGRDPLEPLGAAQQREALTLIIDAILAPEGLSISPALQRRLAPDYLDRAEFLALGTDYALQARLLSLQRSVLNYLLSDAIAHRLLDNVEKLDDPRQAFALAELYRRTGDALWKEVSPAGVRGGMIPGPRRELQREHVNRVAFALVRPSGTARADQRALLRSQAQALLVRLEAAERWAAAAGPRSDEATRAHLSLSAENLRLALAAPLMRQGL